MFRFAEAMNTALSSDMDRDTPATTGADRPQVVYLFGAGASHACVKAVESPHGILMDDLGEPLRLRIHALVEDDYDSNSALTNLVNTVIGDDTDFEHIITFLDQSPSALHRRFANDLRKAFEGVLKDKLKQIEEELGGAPVNLYEALLDMYEVDGCPEELKGIMTLNYDEYIETAMKKIGREVDFGVRVEGIDSSTSTRRLLKLHGSFGWNRAWPITYPVGDTAEPLWIPPGIQKAKDDYPFNVLWGLARELLDCDVLRIVGCRLGPNDWDLISLLFTTLHTHANRAHPYRVEIINSPKNAADLRESYPYLDILSIFETEPAGSRLISEFIGGRPRPHSSLSPEEQRQLDQVSPYANWFRLWLVQMAEASYEELDSIETSHGAFQELMEAT